MTDHVMATLDGAVHAPADAMRWRPEPPPVDWAAVFRTVGKVMTRIAAAFRELFNQLAPVWRQLLAVLRPALRAIADMERHRRARLSAMRREYHRRRR